MRRFCVILIVVLLLSACGGGTPTPEPTLEPTPEPTLQPTPLPPSPINAENIAQLAVRLTLDEKDKLYYDQHLRPDGGAILFNITATSDFSATLTLYDVFTGDILFALTKQDLKEAGKTSSEMFATYTDFKPDSSLVLFALSPLDDGESALVMADATSGETVRVLTIEKSGQAVFAGAGDLIIATVEYGDMGDFKLVAVDAETGDVLGETLTPSYPLTLAVRGNRVAYSTLNGRFVVPFEQTADGVTFGEPIYTSESETLGWPVFSVDGSVFTTYDPTAREVYIYAAEDGARLHTIAIPGEADSRIFTATSDGQWVLVSEEKLIRIFDLEGAILTEVDHFDLVGSALMDSGRISLIASSERGVTIWGIDPNATAE